MKAEEPSDLGDDGEGRASGATGSRRGERDRAVNFSDNISLNNKIVGVLKFEIRHLLGLPHCDYTSHTEKHHALKNFTHHLCEVLTR